MTLRQLVWAAEGRTEFEGGLAAWTVRHIPFAVWSGKELVEAGDLNPYRKGAAESEAMQAHKVWLSRMRLRALAPGGN